MWQKIKHFLLKNSTTRQTVAKNTFWLFVSNVGGRLIRAAAIVYAARVLGASNWGVFSYAITIVAILTTFTDMGIGNILVRETAKNRGTEYATRVFSTIFYIKTALLILGAVAVLVGAPYLSTLQGARVLYPVMVFILLFDAYREFGFAYIRATERMEAEAFVYITANFAIAVFGIAFLVFRPTVKSFAIAYAMGDSVGAIAVIMLLRKKIKDILTNFSRELIWPLISYAWPFVLSSFLALLMVNTDIFIIGLMKPAADVGYYSAALRIVQILYLVPGILAISVFPSLSRLAQQDRQKFRSLLERMILSALAFAIPVGIGGAITGRDIIGFVFGAAYLPAAAAFAILMLTMMADFPATLLSNAIFAHNKQKMLTIYAALGGITNIVLDLILIPKLGITGSAVATLIAQAVGNAFLWRVMKSIQPFAVLPHLKRVLSAAVLMAGVSAFFVAVRVPVIFTVAAGGAVYLGMLALLKEPLLKELKYTLRGSSADLPEAPASPTSAI